LLTNDRLLDSHSEDETAKTLALPITFPRARGSGTTQRPVAGFSHWTTTCGPL